MALAKDAIMRPIGTRNPDPLVAELEDELMILLNETGIGPMGRGGDVTVLHYQNGGLVIDTDAKTTLDGVYACGEIAGGTHGRNRMMGNSLLECVVFGRRAGRAAATAARN